MNVTAIEKYCGFEVKLDKGQKIALRNPNHPGNYSGKINCLWKFTSDVLIGVTCKSVKLPQSLNCDQDYLEITPDKESAPTRLCGVGEYSEKSIAREIGILLSTVSNTSGGKFECIIEAAGAGE
ncbi:hypothetical protein QAD02_016913 [Eretmocerus hayati]|uniref:Uncharacterized protein n=1 Tax=Eretmocerus hayati TaxID=131215 RepID=A0ACC2PCF0_9HYME|nr:hypothetical protein QAD02_016913 [Eretmocerus hayati]